MQAQAVMHDEPDGNVLSRGGGHTLSSIGQSQPTRRR